MHTHDPSLALVNIRSQAAVLRALADQAEQLSRAADVEGLGSQIGEEMTLLGRRLLEATGATNTLASPLL